MKSTNKDSVIKVEVDQGRVLKKESKEIQTMPSFIATPPHPPSPIALMVILS
jgi:hypothetical protein